MKKAIYLLLFSIIGLGINTLFSQDNCKVLKPEIAETYKGGCKKGLAHGKGFANGTDKYEGSFKNGLPNGKGKYTWSTGEVYDGSWKQGKRNGKGKYTYNVNNVDSVKYGYWKNDLFVKKIVPSPYRVIRKMGLSRYSVRKLGEGNQITFSIMKDGNQSSNYSNLFVNSSNGTPFRSGQKPGVENIIFPVKCNIKYTQANSFNTSNFEVEFEIEITEPGTWEIILNN